MKLAESVAKTLATRRAANGFWGQRTKLRDLSRHWRRRRQFRPDMTSIGASSQIDYLIESVYYQQIEERTAFQSYLIETQNDSEMESASQRATTTAN